MIIGSRPAWARGLKLLDGEGCIGIYRRARVESQIGG